MTEKDVDELKNQNINFSDLDIKKFYHQMIRKNNINFLN